MTNSKSANARALRPPRRSSTRHVLLREQAFGVGIVRNAQCRSVPGEFRALKTRRDISELHGLGERTGIVETVARALVREHAIDPRVVMACAGNRLDLEAREFFRWIEFRHSNMRQDERAAFADEEGTATG